MTRSVRKAGPITVPVAEAKDDLSRYLREAAMQEALITRHANPAGVLTGFESEDD